MLKLQTNNSTQKKGAGGFGNDRREFAVYERKKKWDN